MTPEQTTLPSGVDADLSPDRIRELYHDQGLPIDGVANELGVSPTTVYRRMKDYGIERDECPRAEAHVPTRVDYEGYVRWRDQYRGPDGSKREDMVAVHRLAAVAWFGFDSIIGKVVHHCDHIPWDNRQSNLAVLCNREHSKLHNRHENNDHKT